MIFGKELDAILSEFYSTNRGVVVGSFLGSVITFTIESIVMPRMMAKLFISTNDLHKLRDNMIKIVVVWVILQFGHSISDVLDSKVEPALSKFITDKIVNSVFVKYETTHKKIDTPILIQRIILLRMNLEGLINKLFIVLLPRFASVFLIILNFWSINQKVGLITLILVLIQFSITLFNIETCVLKAYEEIESRDRLTSVITDKFENIHTISSVYGGVEKEIKNCEDKSSDMMRLRLDSNSCVLNKQLKNYVSNTLIFSVILGITYKEFVNKKITIEGLSTVLLSMNMFFNQMYDISYHVPELVRRLGVLDSNKKFLKELLSYKEKDGIEMEILSGNIKFNDVTFKYGEDQSNDLFIFKNKNILIKDKQIVGLFGESGSGKSTFVKLLTKIEEPDEGEILVDGKPLFLLKNETVKKYITHISQDMSTLFNSSILYNILYGTEYENTDNSHEVVKNLMYKYNLQNIYKNIAQDDLDELLDYKVGKSGEILSGGQRQMIHLIRAILNKNARILILDEPTSALDVLTKQNVIKMIKEECKDKTVLIISHDEDIKKICDTQINFSSN
jgi:ABC-type multidrug transport system fused ATPase/permease subunit